MQNGYKPDVTLYIVDDNSADRESMHMLFGQACGFRVQSFSSGEEFLDKVQVQKPDCVLLDFRMDDGISGLQVHEALIEQGSPMVVLFLSGHGDIPTATDSIGNGAFGWLVKGSDTTKMRTKVIAAMKEAEVRTEHHQQRLPVLARWNELSPRKKEAARLIRKGWASRLVADEMKIGVRVVDKYRSDVFETLWVNNPTELDRLMRDYDIQ